MKKALVIIICFTSSLLVSAQESYPIDTLKMSLEECLEYAFNNNYNRRIQKINEEAREDSYEQAKAERLPSLSASLSESMMHSKSSDVSWNGNYNLNASMALYQGGKISNTIKTQELQVEKSRFESQQYDNKLTIQILQAFLSALGNEELLQLQQEIVKTSEEQERNGRIRYEAGSILESDYLLLRAQLADDRNSIVESTINRDNSLMDLKSLLSIDPLQPFAIRVPDVSTIDAMRLIPTEDFFMERALEYLPDLKISDYLVEIAGMGVKVSKAGYYPSISLSAGIGTGHEMNYNNFGSQLADKFNQQIGLSVSIPIFDNKKTKSSVNQSRFALQQEEYNRKQTELTLRQSLAQEYMNVVAAESKYDASVTREDAYKQSFEAYVVKYREGAITAVDLLQQQNNYITVMNEYVQNKYSFIFKRKVLDVYMGEEIIM